MPEEMEVEVAAPAKGAEAEAPPPVDPVVAARAELKASLAAVERFVTTREPRFFAQALSTMGTLRALEKKQAAAALEARAQAMAAATDRQQPTATGGAPAPAVHPSQPPSSKGKPTMAERLARAQGRSTAPP